MSKHPIPDLSRIEIENLIDLWIFSERDRAIHTQGVETVTAWDGSVHVGVIHGVA